ncbi:MAG: hypothetical protein GX057_01635 [Clostridiales bacterium]|nr:hypothetical protein [Clostridiales bacterium]
MGFLVISSAVFAFSVVLLVLSPAGKREDIKKRRLDSVVERKKEEFSELDQSMYKRFVAPLVSKFSGIITKRRKTKNKKAKNQRLEANLRYAGLRIGPDEYSFIKNIVTAPLLILPLLFMLVSSIDPTIRVLVLLIGVVLWVLAPRYFLSSRITSRQRRIKQQLPEVLDLMSVSIEAGLGFDAALCKIAEKMQGPLIDEMSLLYREIQLGRPRRDALRDFGECSLVPELKTFSSALIQADKLGIPIKNLLKTQSEQIRTARRQAAQEKGMKSPVKMMLPMVAFIFPVLFIILLGPVVVQLITQFKK